MTYLQAVILGIVQGLTEFLPVSSSAHLALAERYMGMKAESDAVLMFDLATHVGTVASIFVVFAGSIRRFAARLAEERLPALAGRRVAWRVLALGIVASVPTAVMGLLFKDTFERAFGEPKWIGIGLCITGAGLWMGQRFGRPHRGWRRFEAWRAVVIGIAQGVAIWPGISRSGSTISCALLLGIKRRWAAEFSFLIGMPAILGAAALKLRDVLGDSAMLDSLSMGPLVVGTLAAFLTGYFALRILLTAVRRAKLQLFSYYCWVAGLAVLVWVK